MNEMHLAAASVLVAYGLFCWYFLRRELCRIFSRQQVSRGATSPLAVSSRPLLIGYASQSGQAEQLARECATRLRRQQAQQQTVTALPLNQISPELLRHAQVALFFVSTYGEGEPPDNALRFHRRWLRNSSGTELASLRVAVLALGDSHYRNFCHFGQQLSDGLSRHGAIPLFEPVKADKLDPQALRLWQLQLNEHGIVGAADAPAPKAVFSEGMLIDRTCLNVGSAGGPVWLVRIRPPEDTHWQAGDILQIQPRNDPALPLREYSIASVKQDKSLNLLVRQVTKASGEMGLGSGWLTHTTQPGDAIRLRLRRNPAFHAPPTSTPLILIGNGTGMAGLHALLRERELAGARRNLLFFGERNRAWDYFFQARIERWYQEGFLVQMHLAFSRDQPTKIYVQHLLADQAETLVQWIHAGAAVYVCGSLEGMAGAVERVLQSIIGDETLAQMKLDGRYRRDVY